MIPDSKQQGVYHCRIHKFTHRCTYIADERWGPDIIHQRYSGYTCPTEFDEESGEIRCKPDRTPVTGGPTRISVCVQCAGAHSLSRGGHLPESPEQRSDPVEPVPKL